jgi:hypothetical protein
VTRADTQEANVRDDDSNLISREGLSKPLSFGEKRCLEQQARNRRESTGSPAEVEARQGCTPVSTAMKTPRRTVY